MEITAWQVFKTINNLKKSGTPYREEVMYGYIRRWGQILMLELYERPMKWPKIDSEIGHDDMPGCMFITEGLTLGNIMKFGEN